MEETTQTQQKKFELENGGDEFSKKMITRIIQTIESIPKTKNVIEIDGYENKFIVRKGKAAETLKKEAAEGKVIHEGSITVKMRGSLDKTVTFSVWTRINSSEVLL